MARRDAIDAIALAIGRAVWKHYRKRAAARILLATKSGRLPRLLDVETPCVDCGKRALVYEHRNYLRPLDVVPTCDSCNHKRGPARLSVRAVLRRLP